MYPYGSKALYVLLDREMDGLRSILLAWDPLGVREYSDPHEQGPDDEYDCLILPLVRHLLDFADAMTVARYLGDELRDHFGVGKGKPETVVAARIVDWFWTVLAAEAGYVVSTERLGWPQRSTWTGFRRRRDPPLHGDVPTATCHVQPGFEEPALCGYRWEALRLVPLAPKWDEVIPELRCEECTALVDDPDRNSAPASYVGELDRPH